MSADAKRSPRSPPASRSRSNPDAPKVGSTFNPCAFFEGADHLRQRGPETSRCIEPQGSVVRPDRRHATQADADGDNKYDCKPPASHVKWPHIQDADPELINQNDVIELNPERHARADHGRFRRYSLGDRPARFRKATEKELVSAKPTTSAMSVTDRLGSANNLFAQSIRRFI
jgi:hypothetical protein